MAMFGGRQTARAALDPAILGYLVDGDHGKAVEARRAAGLGVLVLFQNQELRALWHRHRPEVEAEAKRRHRRPWARYLDESDISRATEQTPKEPLRSWRARLRAEDEEP